MTRICIGQLVRPDGTLLTEGLSPESMGPTFGYNWWDHGLSPDSIQGATYARWRFQGEGQWKVVYYWPEGPGSLPAYVDNTGEGKFLSLDPSAPGIDRDEVACQLMIVAAAV